MGYDSYALRKYPPRVVMKKTLCLLFAVLVFASISSAEDGREKAIDRVDDAGTVLREIMSAPDSGIPEEIFNSAKCVAVVPSLLKGGLGIGAAYGKGVAS